MHIDDTWDESVVIAVKKFLDSGVVFLLICYFFLFFLFYLFRDL